MKTLKVILQSRHEACLALSVVGAGLIYGFFFRRWIDVMADRLGEHCGPFPCFQRLQLHRSPVRMSGIPSVSRRMSES